MSTSGGQAWPDGEASLEACWLIKREELAELAYIA
jgi:hypothetical protein